MFESNVIETYNFRDASNEILIMLLGALLLGSLLTWLLCKLFNNDTSTTNRYYYEPNANDDIESSQLTQNNFRQTANTEQLEDLADIPTKNIVSDNDDLTKIGSIDTHIQDSLKQHGINTFADLRDIDHTDMRSIQKDLEIDKREIETWPHQASLAANGNWGKLKEYQAFIKHVQVSSIKKFQGTDDLTLIQGITPEVRYILNNNNIYSYQHLNQIDSTLLKETLMDADPRFEVFDTESWSHQAAMAEKNQWEELKIYQGFLDSDSSESISLKHKENQENSSIGRASSLDTYESYNKYSKQNTPKFSARAGDLTEVAKQENDTHHVENKVKEDDSSVVSKEVYDSLKVFDTKTIDEDITNEENEIANVKSDAKDTLETKDLDHQALTHPTKEQRPSLTTKDIDDAKIDTDSTTAEPNKSVEKEVTFDTDDNFSDHDSLRKIEGIGPKIEGILNKGGIYTYSQLAKSDVSRLRGLLDAAGSQFKMHNPESWPRQAKMADNGDWEGIQSYRKVKTVDKTTGTNQVNLTETTAKAKGLRVMDDLTKIEGIGPKIQELLNKHNINTFKELAGSSNKKIKSYLDEAGPQFRMHDPESWPYQAKLASDNEWDALAKYQDFLVRGRK